MDYLGFGRTDFQTQAHTRSGSGNEAADVNCTAEPNFQFTTDMLWKKMKEMKGLFLDK